MALGRPLPAAATTEVEGEDPEARPRRRLDRVQHAADRDPLPAGAGRGDGLLGQLDHPGPAQRRPLQQRLLPEADADLRRRRADRSCTSSPATACVAVRRADPDPARRLDLPPGRGARRRPERQRRQPLDRLRLAADPALGAGQGGADPLRRRPARAQAEAGALDRRLHALPPGRRRRLPADHDRARHGDDDGRSPSPSAPP